MDTSRLTTVCCIRWGLSYGIDDTNLLHRAVREHLPVPHRFVCITDHPEGLDSGIIAVPWPDFPLHPDRWVHGMWPKLLMFHPKVLSGNGPVLFLDLDTLVTGDLRPLVDRVASQRGLHIIREWNPALYACVPLRWRPDRGSNSSVVGFIPAEQHHLWKTFERSPEDWVSREGANDQRFINDHAFRKHYWPASWCRSFRRSCVWYHPFSRWFVPRLPPDTRLLCFHGKPKPGDLVKSQGVRWGTSRKWDDRPVEWVVSYYQRHGFLPASAPEGPAPRHGSVPTSQDVLTSTHETHPTPPAAGDLLAPGSSIAGTQGPLGNIPTR